MLANANKYVTGRHLLHSTRGKAQEGNSRRRYDTRAIASRLLKRDANRGRRPISTSSFTLSSCEFIHLANVFFCTSSRSSATLRLIRGIDQTMKLNLTNLQISRKDAFIALAWILNDEENDCVFCQIVAF